ncbi:sensor histidine kinase [Chondromyces crocatus]|uniref:sensor histidine kinase n=1 Tax=Chondromyces crocatus TaxID=52 RepID=UPI001FDEF7DD|nr:sensor histidine kinase [Chondromyces crocatus]
MGLTSEAGPPPPLIIEEGTGGVEGTLERLDEAVSMLASLHGRPVHRGRRGRIDLAELVWEVAPEARVQIEMGDGTAVFGDESELRRMLQVLIAQSGDPSGAASTPEVSLRRVGDEVAVSVNLGPDTTASIAHERAWLSRMALRYGGRLELDGAMQTLTFPADVDLARRELESLKKELAAAQAQGEAYARELAAVFSQGDRSGGRGAHMHTSQLPPAESGLPLLVAATRVLGTQLRGILAAVGRDIAPLREHGGEAGEVAASVGRHVTAASEIVSDLARLGACPLDELPRHADIAHVLRDVVHDELARAARREVHVRVETPDSAHEVVPLGALTVLLHALLDHAIGVSAGGSDVLLTLTEQEASWDITFDDAGAPIPAQARGILLSRDFEAVAHGRPSSFPLIVAHAVAAHAHMDLTIEDHPGGGTRARLSIPKTG